MSVSENSTRRMTLNSLAMPGASRIAEEFSSKKQRPPPQPR
jgi:hypothetical protein